MGFQGCQKKRRMMELQDLLWTIHGSEPWTLWSIEVYSPRGAVHGQQFGLDMSCPFWDVAFRARASCPQCFPGADEEALVEIVFSTAQALANVMISLCCWYDEKGVVAQQTPTAMSRASVLCR